MVRTALLAMALAFGGGAASYLDLVTVWVADEVDAGNIWDPFGGAAVGNGSDAGNDAGAIWDPFG
jgi:hypothetical protein